MERNPKCSWLSPSGVRVKSEITGIVGRNSLVKMADWEPKVRFLPLIGWKVNSSSSGW